MSRSTPWLGSPRASRVVAFLLVPWIAWTVNQISDPIHGISREDLGLAGEVTEVVSEEASVFSSASGLREGKRVVAERIVFGAEGRVQEWIEYDGSDEPDTTRRYMYANDRLIREEEYGRRRWPDKTIEYTHEAGGRRTVAEFRSSNGTLRKTIVYERDAKGRLTSVAERDGSGTETSRVVYTCGEGEQRADRYGPDGELTSWSIERFDAQGRVVEVAMHTKGAEAPPFLISYTYDRYGNVILETTSGRPIMPFTMLSPIASETKTSYDYIYDEHGNWVKRVTSVWVPAKDDEESHWQPMATTYRTIRYVTPSS